MTPPAGRETRPLHQGKSAKHPIKTQRQGVFPAVFVWILNTIRIFYKGLYVFLCFVSPSGSDRRRRSWDSFSAEKPGWLRRATGTPPRAAFRIPLYKFPCLHSKKPPARGGFCYVAERVGFEPTDTRISPVFKTGAFNHSTISPCFGGVYCNINPAGGQSVFNREFCRKARSRRCAIRSPEDTGRCRRQRRYFRGHISCRWPADRFPFPPAG